MTTNYDPPALPRDLLLVRTFVGAGTRYIHVRTCGHTDCEQSPELMAACIRRLVWGEPPKLIARCANKQDLADIAEGRPVFKVADEKQVRRYGRNGPVCSRCMKVIGAATRAPFDRRAP